MRYGKINVESTEVFYREAGAADAPALVLFHGFPSASHMCALACCGRGQQKIPGR